MSRCERSASAAHRGVGLEPVGGTPEQFARQYRDDYDKYARLTRELGIRLE